MPTDIGRDHIGFGSVYVRAPSAVPQIADVDGMVPDCRVGSFSAGTRPETRPAMSAVPPKGEVE